MAVLLGIDIGTTGTKTIALDAERGSVLASAVAEYELLTPRPGWTEQRPEDWWQAVIETIRGVLAAGVDAADVTGIGLSGQMHGSVFLDAAGRVIRPALLWNDQRTAEQCERINAAAGELLRDELRNPVLTGFQAGKIVWLRDVEPEHFARVRQVLLPKDYLRYRLTGEFATEVSDASGTALLNVLKLPIPQDREKIPDIVGAAFRERFACRWLVPLGFDNTYVLAVRGADARRNGWRSISDLAPHAPGLRAGFTSEFVERPDGYPGLRARYGIAFAAVRDFGPELMYEAIGRGELDVACAFSTDGRIQEYGLVPLEDDLHFFPPYEAALVVREATLDKHPDLGPALLRLARKLDDATMRRLNHQADIAGRRPREIAAEFLREAIGNK